MKRDAYADALAEAEAAAEADAEAEAEVEEEEEPGFSFWTRRSEAVDKANCEAKLAEFNEEISRCDGRVRHGRQGRWKGEGRGQKEGDRGQSPCRSNEVRFLPLVPYARLPFYLGSLHNTIECLYLLIKLC